ncbi:hypothetical protein SELMODRAFT_443035 [Selaginella moellendorffii]|uniref:Protein kinase domain-containing protein n=1 Tax=Selaginella moellendorffii TaxID=88036 RepID=D8RXX8_SELML|nr:hypothetical protein SELMODRAFT_443035 [Selaginella moellendorffii]
MADAELQRLGRGDFGIVYDGGAGVALKLLHGDGVKPGAKRIPYEELKEEAETAQRLHQAVFDMDLKAVGVPMPYAVLRSGKDLVLYSLVGGAKERDWLRSHTEQRPFCDGIIAMERIFGPERCELEALKARYYPDDPRWAELLQSNRVWKLQLGLFVLPPPDIFFKAPCVLAREASECLGLDVPAVARDMGRLVGAARRMDLSCNDVQYVVGRRWGSPRLQVFVLDFGFARDGRTNPFHDDYYPKTEDVWAEFIQGFRCECDDEKALPVMGVAHTTPLPPPPKISQFPPRNGGNLATPQRYVVVPPPSPNTQEF